MHSNSHCTARLLARTLHASYGQVTSISIYRGGYLPAPALVCSGHMHRVYSMQGKYDLPQRRQTMQIHCHQPPLLSAAYKPLWKQVYNFGKRVYVYIHSQITRAVRARPEDSMASWCASVRNMKLRTVLQPSYAVSPRTGENSVFSERRAGTAAYAYVRAHK